jgi:hypothetical protein
MYVPVPVIAIADCVVASGCPCAGAACERRGRRVLCQHVVKLFFKGLTTRYVAPDIHIHTQAILTKQH